MREFMPLDYSCEITFLLLFYALKSVKPFLKYCFTKYVQAPGKITKFPWFGPFWVPCWVFSPNVWIWVMRSLQFLFRGGRKQVGWGLGLVSSCDHFLEKDEYDAFSVLNQNAQNRVPGWLTSICLCEVVECAENEHVENYKCVSCPVGMTNEAGDQATSGTTVCDVPSSTFHLTSRMQYCRGSKCVNDLFIWSSILFRDQLNIYLDQLAVTLITERPHQNRWIRIFETTPAN